MVDVSMCRYLTTTTTPYKYYWDYIIDCMQSMASSPEKAEQFCKVRKEEFRALMQEVDIRENNPKINSLLASYVVHYIFMDAIKTADKDSYVPFALEYYEYDPEIMSNISKRPTVSTVDGFFIEKRDSIIQLIRFQPMINSLLSKDSRFGYTIVVDFKTLRRDIKRCIRTYYLNNPEMRNNMLPDKNLKAEIAKIFERLSNELISKALEEYNQTPKKESNTTWDF